MPRTASWSWAILVDRFSTSMHAVQACRSRQERTEPGVRTGRTAAVRSEYATVIPERTRNQLTTSIKHQQSRNHHQSTHPKCTNQRRQQSRPEKPQSDQIQEMDFECNKTPLSPTRSGANEAPLYTYTRKLEFLTLILTVDNFASRSLGRHSSRSYANRLRAWSGNCNRC